MRRRGHGARRVVSKSSTTSALLPVASVDQLELHYQQEGCLLNVQSDDAKKQKEREEDEKRNAAAEVRRQALDEARRQAEAEVRQQAEMMQAQMKAQAEQLVRQQQEQAAQAQRQAEVLQHVTKWPSWRGHSWPPRAPRAASEGSGLAF